MLYINSPVPYPREHISQAKWPSGRWCASIHFLLHSGCPALGRFWQLGCDVIGFVCAGSGELGDVTPLIALLLCYFTLTPPSPKPKWRWHGNHPSRNTKSQKVTHQQFTFIDNHFQFMSNWIDNRLSQLGKCSMPAIQPLLRLSSG